MSTDLVVRRSERTSTWFSQVSRRLIDLNLFQSVPPSTDPQQLRKQRISTRAFIALLALSLTILLIYTSAVTVIKTITVPAPTVDLYQQLYEKYHQTLACPCEQISVSYETFVNVTYQLHAVCDSGFVSDNWISSLVHIPDVESLATSDFRLTGIGSFQALKAFCELSERTISTDLAQFYSNNFIGAFVTPAHLLQSQAGTFIRQFISSSTNSLAEALDRMRDSIQANALLSGHQQNYRLRRNTLSRILVPDSMVYDGGCLCMVDATCITPSIINRSDLTPSVWIVPGFYTGCFATESLRMSDLQCLYDDDCWNELKIRLGFAVSMNIPALSPRYGDRYSPNTPIGILVDQLMVEDWHHSIVYEKYYQSCRPLECSYTVTTRNDVIYIITTLISLVGGLVTMFKWIIHRLLWLINHRATLRTGHIQHPSTILKISINHVCKLNLFESVPPSIDPQQLRKQRISTRVFIALLALSLTILLIYTSAVTVTKIITVATPTVDQYQELYAEYHQTLACPCKEISVSYETFINVTYTLHRVCDSDFINDGWLLLFADITYEEAPVLGDFLLTSTQIFQGLRALCQSVQKTISVALLQFFATHHVNLLVTSMDVFYSESNAWFEQFVTAVENDYVLSLQWIRETSQANALFAAVGTNFLPYVENGKTTVTRALKTYDNCSCSTSALCTQSAAIHKNKSSSSAWYVRGFRTGCYLLEGLRQSSLECLYEEECFEELLLHIPRFPSANITLLNRTAPSRFSTNTTIGVMLNRLMVENWFPSIDYEAYYRACQPLHCVYSLDTRNDLIYIITTLIGLIGGLITGYKLTVPIAVSYLLNKFRKENNAPSTTSLGIDQRERCHLCHKLSQYVRELNLFKSVPPSTDPHRLRMQRISTRVFIALLSLSLVILLIYTSAVTITKTVTVPAPTVEQYHPALTCPCQEISVNYETFVNVTYTLHQVCDSDFVSDDWLHYILSAHPGVLFIVDFRITAAQIFQALKMLCQLVRESITRSLTQFYATDYVSVAVMTNASFNVQVGLLIAQFISSTTNNFALALQRIRDVTQANGLVSALSTNFAFKVYNDSQDVTITWTYYDNACICGFSTACNSPSYMYFNLSLDRFWPVPGFFVGCFALESLRQCNLACFYDQACLDEVLIKMNPSASFAASALDATLLSRFAVLTPLGTILDLLMVENWTSSISYQQYYGACRPSHCTYTLSARNDNIQIITTLIGLLGGLVTTLKLIVPTLVFVLQRFISRWRKHRARVQPEGQ